MDIKKQARYGCILVFSFFFLCACISQKRMDQILSWQDTALRQPEETLQLLQKQGIKRIYQYPSQGVSSQQWESFLRLSASYDIDVYAMQGDPAWIDDKDGKQIKDAIDAIYTLDQSVGGQKIKGILLDVEPYQYEGYKKDPEHWMGEYEHVMKIAYTHAKTYGYEIILCIPYSFDQRGFYDTIEELMMYCDEIAIMNYQKKEEWKQIEQEVALANAYHKPVVVLYELQPAGSYGLTDDNTYHKDGLQAVYDSFQAIRKQANGGDLQLGFHELESFLSLMEK